mmetsp:Transcript_12888/g.30428  ORF Transcript_12888/g.30428 Transcript_12888/m.30428 type:complete len:889 (+) Transcript_12888:518-3184(+)|eukprot:CAMPEP_0197178012 /NCGR_PEP_ID=MMETSP1423-20130617/3417_1 /TAXON_ID=476441 /ORGANISM="Pseudo-nitzschia heimii, Strain UNC1101" /LENGTH=888 /DNA_ID=CAMNT_0042627655 /DNA_START=421 /DNA_END=3087 /DNA_ORIENTATION=+
MSSYFSAVKSNQTTSGIGKNNDSSSCNPARSVASPGFQSNFVSSFHNIKVDEDAHLEVQEECASGYRHDYKIKTGQTQTHPSPTIGTGDVRKIQYNQHLPRHDRDNSDSTTSSTEESHAERLALMMTSLLPHNKSREKQRRRTRPLSRRTNVNINNAPTHPMSMHEYGKTCNNEVPGPRAAWQRLSEALPGSFPLSSKRRSFVKDSKRLNRNCDEYSFEQSQISEYSSPGFSSESTNDTSPYHHVSDRPGLQQYQYHDIPIQVQHRSSSRRKVASRKSLSSSGNDSIISSTNAYNPSKCQITKSPSSSTLKSTKTKAITSSNIFSLAGVFVGVIILCSCRMILFTMEAAQTTLRQEQFVLTLVNLPDDNSLRGKQVLGRISDTGATMSEGISTNQDSSGSNRQFKKAESIDNNSSYGNGAVLSGSQSKADELSESGVTTFPMRLQMHLPVPGSLRVEPKYHTVDRNLHNPSYNFRNDTNADTLPRTVMLDPRIKQVSRKIEMYPADFTDNTQLYGILPSDDEHLTRMEIREPYSNNECVPMQEWQTMYQPSCNGMHELALQTLGKRARTDEENSLKTWHRGRVEGLNATLFGTKGFWRYAWKVVIDYRDHGKAEEDTIVFKNLKYEHNFEDAHFEHDRIDAVAMERLTSSPHVINIFGFCGHSVMTEYADGKRLGELADKSKKIPLKRLEIARDIATGLADVHGIDGDGNATFVHLDVNPANVVSVKKTLKLNDFNIGIIRQWNTTSNNACGFPSQYPNPQWRSPEEARNEQHLTEKVDVFSLGHIFFRLICGHEPWNKLEPAGRPSKAEINEKVQRGDLPFVPDHVINSDDPEIIAIRDIMLKCYSFDPADRPSARYIANSFDRILSRLRLKYASNPTKSKKKKSSS